MVEEIDDQVIQESDNTLSTGEERVRVQIPAPYVPPPQQQYESPAQEDDAYAVRESREASKRVRKATQAVLDGGGGDGNDSDGSFTVKERRPKRARPAPTGEVRRAHRGTTTEPPIRVGQEVCLKGEAERGIVTERLAGSWLLVRYCSGYESKQRPGQLSALLGGPGLEPLTEGERLLCKEPLDQVASLQAHVDRDVIVATTGGTMGPGIRNVFDDKNGVRRRQFVVFRDEGMLSVRCEVCEARQILSDTIRNVAEKDPSKVCHALKAHCGYYAGSRASSDSERHIRNLQLMLPDTAGRVGFGLVGNAKDTGNYRGNKGGRPRKTAPGGSRGAAGPGRPPKQKQRPIQPLVGRRADALAGPVIPAPDVGPTASGEPRVLVKVPLRGGRVAEATVTWKSADARCATPEAFAADVQERFELDENGTKAIAADIARQLAAHRAYAAALAPPPVNAVPGPPIVPSALPGAPLPTQGHANPPQDRDVGVAPVGNAPPGPPVVPSALPGAPIPESALRVPQALKNIASHNTPGPKASSSEENVPDNMKAAADHFRHERRDDSSDDEDVACLASDSDSDSDDDDDPTGGQAAALAAARAASDEAIKSGKIKACPFDAASFDTCEACGQGGDLLCCDYCPRVWHAACCTKGAASQIVIDGEEEKNWRCGECDFDWGRYFSPDLQDDRYKAARAACQALSRDKDDAACAEVRVALFLDSVRTHAFRKYFAEPVPSRNLAGYEHVVARPMDLGTIEKRLKSGAYAGSTGAARAVSDVRAVWHACALYNEPRSPIYRAGTILDGIWTGCHEKAIASTLKEEHFNLLERQAGALAREREQAPQVFDRYVTAVVAGRA